MVNTKFLSDIDERLLEMAESASVEHTNAVPEDIVPAIEFLLSDKSNYMTGVNLNISNGNVIC